MEIVHLVQALTPEGIEADVRLAIEGGTIRSVAAGVARDPAAVFVPGLTLPGLPNLHSHAFQRGMAGLGERRGPGEDSFWTWREVMYRFLDRLTPDDVLAIAAQAYVEMLEGGFTAVAEFHYLHHDIDGRPYGARAAMADAIVEAARETGLGLTLLPVLYRFGNFGGAPFTPGQRRFICDRDLFARLLEDTRAAIASLPDAAWGVAPHSLRAVGLDDLAFCETLAENRPLHMHVAEQRKEVEDSLAATGRRPLDLLAETTRLDARWVLIHATHLAPAERGRLAGSGAVAGLCPVTEGNLGDGFFDGVAYREEGGRLGVGTDSNVEIGVGPELRGLEYSQRLRDERRGRMAAPGASVGRTLYGAALAGGAQACGRAIGALAPGHRADLVTLDGEHPSLVGRSGEALIDSAIFAAAQMPVAEVRVGGRLVVAEGRHLSRAPIAQRYRETMRRLLA
jgi:formiminoglutamate deiminase